MVMQYVLRYLVKCTSRFFVDNSGQRHQVVIIKAGKETSQNTKGMFMIPISKLYG